MACTPFRLSNGGSGFICGPKRPAKTCRACWNERRPSGVINKATRLCDGPKPGGTTCDAPICAEHATRTGPNTDPCPECVAAGQRADGTLF